MTTSPAYRPAIRVRAARLLSKELGPYSPAGASAEPVGRLAAWLRMSRETLCRVWMNDRRISTSRPAGVVLYRFYSRRPS